MTTCMHRRAAPGIATLVAAFALLCTQAMAAETVSPLPPSAYAVRAACPAPAPGHATCLALKLVARTAAAAAHTRPLGMARAADAIESAAPSPQTGQLGLRPEDLHSAYRLPTEASSTQTIALVDAYNDPHAETDLERFDTEFGLPTCTKANSCFEQVNQNGQTSPLPFPQNEADFKPEETLCEDGQETACELVEEAEGWSVEISLDIETAHATCQNCHIALVEADSTEYEDLEAAENSAVLVGANEISNSWGGPECIEELGCAGESAAFDHPGTVITVAAGDDGYRNWLIEEPQAHYVNFPASLPQVVSVGGTRLSTLGTSGEWTGESVWNDGGESGGVKDGHGAGGGGCSTQFTAQPWQRDVADWAQVGCGPDRAVADVSADADPYSGVAVYDSSAECETPYLEESNGKKVKHVLHDWCTIGGTSLASPLVASTYALAGGAHGVKYPARTLYENASKSPGSLHDVTEGSNGECKLPFTDEGGGVSPCIASEEAQTSCEAQLKCLAATGYDGPTGVGTPDGIAAFEPPAGATAEEGSSSAPAPAPVSPSSASSAGSSRTGSSATPLATGTAPAASARPVQLSGLALTLKAVIAMNRSHPKIAALTFTFTLNLAARVHASLEERVGRHGRLRWKTLGHSLTIAAPSGRNSQHLGGAGVLSPGAYRLTLAPVGGMTRSIVFKIG
jgi:hypothetical protein